MKDGHDLKEDRESDVVPSQEHFPWGDTNKPALFLYRKESPRARPGVKKSFSTLFIRYSTGERLASLGRQFL